MADSKRLTFIRYGLSGIIFTILGPSLFWVTYPLGPFEAVAITEVSVHTIRYITFKKFVFPARAGYRVSVKRYILSVFPVTASGIIVVALLRDKLSRTSLTMAGMAISILVGFLWSQYVYKKPVAES